MTPVIDGLVLLDTDVWSHLFSDARRRHPEDARWRELLLGRTIAIATQTRAEVLAGAAIAKWGEPRTLALQAQLAPQGMMEGGPLQYGGALVLAGTAYHRAIRGPARVAGR